MKHIVRIVIFTSFVCALPLFSMNSELRCLSNNHSQPITYSSIAEQALVSIDNQKIRISKVRSITDLKLSEIHGYFKSLTDNKKRELIKTMTTRLLMLCSAATCLPPEVVKDHIFFSCLMGIGRHQKNFMIIF